MKRRVVTAGALMLAAACMDQGAVAQTATPVSYVGGAFFTTVTSSCTLVGFAKKQGFTVVYRPGANGENVGLNLQFQLGSALITTTGTTLNGKRSFTSTGIDDKAEAYTSSGTSSLVVTISSDQLSATITGNINDLYGDSSCTLYLRAALTQRP